MNWIDDAEMIDAATLTQRLGPQMEIPILNKRVLDLKLDNDEMWSPLCSPNATSWQQEIGLTWLRFDAWELKCK